MVESPFDFRIEVVRTCFHSLGSSSSYKELLNSWVTAGAMLAAVPLSINFLLRSHLIHLLWKHLMLVYSHRSLPPCKINLLKSLSQLFRQKGGTLVREGVAIVHDWSIWQRNDSACQPFRASVHHIIRIIITGVEMDDSFCWCTFKLLLSKTPYNFVDLAD